MLDPENHSEMTMLTEVLANTKLTGYINGRVSRLPLLRALLIIRDMPIPEQDNMVAANMRKVARDALAEDATNERKTKT